MEKSAGPPKKRRKSRTAFSNHQIYELEKRFLYQKYLTPADRDEIAQSLGLSNAQVITWFQNRRAKLKRDLEELKADVKATTQNVTEGTLKTSMSSNTTSAATAAAAAASASPVNEDEQAKSGQASAVVSVETDEKTAAESET